MKLIRSAVSAKAYVAVWMMGIGMAWWARARLSPPCTESVFGPGRGGALVPLAAAARAADAAGVIRGF